MTTTHRLLAALILAALATTSGAGTLRDRVRERRAAQHEDSERAGKVVLPPGVKVIRDVAYGPHRDQRFDVYLPAGAVHDAPVIFMVHGGGWSRGDKAMRSVVENKLAHYAPQGFVFISVNYRMIPDAAPLEQAGDVARALSLAQRDAAKWGASPARFVVMGHSAGAHLVSLMAASPSIRKSHGVRPWLATVSLDSAALNVEAIMTKRHAALYDEAFGDDPAAWRAASPLVVLDGPMPPFIAVCSAGRDASCTEAERFVTKARSFNVPSRAIAVDLSHREINDTLGEDRQYTNLVDAALRKLAGVPVR